MKARSTTWPFSSASETGVPFWSTSPVSGGVGCRVSGAPITFADGVMFTCAAVVVARGCNVRDISAPMPSPPASASTTSNA
jgi:hypothetical protein